MTQKPKSNVKGLISETEISLGLINGVFGIRGEVRLFLHNRDSDLLFEKTKIDVLLPSGVRRDVEIQARPGSGKRIIAKITGVDTPEDARALHGAELVYCKDRLPDLDADTYYHYDLLGLPVRRVNGENLGVLKHIVTGGIDVWVIEHGDEEIFIPAVANAIVSVEIGVEIVVEDE